jgi:DNA-binding winged helix-turn-helix (wHTH) protein/TolB-like protein
MIYRFGVFEFDDETKELRRNGRAAALEPQPAKALALLLSRAADRGGSRANEIVSREELRDAVWGSDTHVDFDRGLAYCISQIRTALGDSGENPRFVQTVPKRGFKFIAPMARADSVAAAAVAPAALGVLQAPHPMSRQRPMSKPRLAATFVLFALLMAGGYYAQQAKFDSFRTSVKPTIIGVSIFDNETGMAEHDRLVAGLSDLVVARLTALDRDRLAIVGNATILRQPRNIRNLKAVAQSLQADYVLLGQLQKGEDGLRFITHFIRLRDEAHLRANRLTMKDGAVTGLEAAVVEEFERAVREHVLNRPAN